MNVEVPPDLFGEETSLSVGADVLEESKRVYLQAVMTFQGICEELKSTEATVDCNPLKLLVDHIIDLIKKDRRMLLGLANAPYSYVRRQVEGTLYSNVVIHGMNVMIYSLMMAIELAVVENRLAYIGVAAITSRLGLLNLDEETLAGEVELEETDSERDEHENQAKQYIDRMAIDNFHMESIEFLINFVKDEQGSLGKTSVHEAIFQYAMVIHICSEFEKLTHQTTYGDVFSPVDAMKKMRDEMKDCFNQDIIKLFFNKLSIYPMGSFVKLSSRETAKIVDINENFIMRPVIMVVLDNQGREKEPPTRINLRQKPNVYIKKAIVDDFLTEKFIDLF